MGKMKELMIDRQNDIDDKINELNENTKELQSMNFENDTDLSKIKEIISESLKVIRELKEIILL